MRWNYLSIPKHSYWRLAVDRWFKNQKLGRVRLSRWLFRTSLWVSPLWRIIITNLGVVMKILHTSMIMYELLKSCTNYTYHYLPSNLHYLSFRKADFFIKKITLFQIPQLLDYTHGRVSGSPDARHIHVLCYTSLQTTMIYVSTFMVVHVHEQNKYTYTCVWLQKHRNPLQWRHMCNLTACIDCIVLRLIGANNKEYIEYIV